MTGLGAHMSEFLQRFLKTTTAQRLARFGLRPDVVAAAQAMVSDPRTDPQIVQLETSLTEAETVLRMMDGRHRGEPGLLVLTDERVLFRPRRSDDLVGFSVLLSKIDSIEGSTHRVVGTVRITSADGDFVVDNILGTQGEMLADEAGRTRRGTPRHRRTHWRYSASCAGYVTAVRSPPKSSRLASPSCGAGSERPPAGAACPAQVWHQHPVTRRHQRIHHRNPPCGRSPASRTTTTFCVTRQVPAARSACGAAGREIRRTRPFPTGPERANFQHPSVVAGPTRRAKCSGHC